MEDSEALLRFIHKNAAMGVGTLPQALSLPQSRAMTSALQDQLREYRSIAARSQSYAKEKGLHLKGPGSAALTMSGMMLRAQTALDPSTSKLAEMMIQGSNMGILPSLENPVRDKRLRYQALADRSLQDLAQWMEQENIAPAEGKTQE